MEENNFTALWQNRLDQLGVTTLDLVITHEESIIPQRWIHKSYRMAPEAVDENFLQAEAEKAVAQVVDEWNAEQAAEALAAEQAAQTEEPV